jgi:hypothetical protein
MQPAFLPWLGFFELALKADRFVLLDDFQFSVQSWHQRNRLFVGKRSVDWYSVPVRHDSYGRPLNEAVIDESKPWRKKMGKRIAQSYSRAPYYDSINPAVRAWLDAPVESLAELDIGFIMIVLRLLDSDTEIVRSSRHSSEAVRSARVLELLRSLGATRYLCARGAFDYMREDENFPVVDIEVVFQRFAALPYAQVNSPDEFVPQLSVLDALMNVGPEATRALVESGTQHWWSWEEMCHAESLRSEVLR